MVNMEFQRNHQFGTGTGTETETVNRCERGDDDEDDKKTDTGPEGMSEEERSEYKYLKCSNRNRRFMDSELELHESIQELHALATMPDLYPLSVELNLATILLRLLPHENADVSLIQEVTDVDTIKENEEATSVLIDSLLDQQAISLLTHNLDRLDEGNKDEFDGVHNTLAIFENLFEIRPQLCTKAGESVSYKITKRNEFGERESAMSLLMQQNCPSPILTNGKITFAKRY